MSCLQWTAGPTGVSACQWQGWTGTGNAEGPALRGQDRQVLLKLKGLLRPSRRSFCVLLLTAAAGAQPQVQQMKGLAGAAVKLVVLQTFVRRSEQQAAGTLLTSIGSAGSSTSQIGIPRESRRTSAGRTGL